MNNSIKNEKYVIVAWNTSWADEIDFQEFGVYTENDWKEIADKLRVFGSIKRYFCGTNEENYYYIGIHLLDELSVTVITKEERDTFVKLIGHNYTLNFPSFHFLFE
jgi:hypothetical protein